jgi:hypothetical protein
VIFNLCVTRLRSICLTYDILSGRFYFLNLTSVRFALQEVALELVFLQFLRFPPSHVSSEVLTAVNISMLLFWVVTSCGLVGKYLKTETVCFFETLVSTYEYTRRHNPEEHQHFPYHPSTIARSIFIYHRPKTCAIILIKQHIITPSVRS